MRKFAYQSGVKTALQALGLQAMSPLQTEYSIQQSPFAYRQYRQFLSKGDSHIQALNKAMMLQMLNPDKLAGLRVPVTNEQTPQAVSFKATNPQTQRLSIDSLWDNHDKRLTQFVEPSWNY